MEWRYRPARDLGLPPAERLRSLVRERSLGGIALHAGWRLGVRAYLRLLHRLPTPPAGTLPPAPFVLVSNHSSHLDALVLASAVRGADAHRTFTLAAGDVFFAHPALSAFVAYAVNALPLWRARPRRADLQTLRDRLTTDRLVYIMFPEGTRSRDGAMAPFQPGIGALVAGSDVPVVPCHIVGAFTAWPPGARVPRPGRLRLRIGEARAFPDVGDDAEGRARVASACEAAVRELAAGWSIIPAKSSVG